MAKLLVLTISTRAFTIASMKRDRRRSVFFPFLALTFLTFLSLLSVRAQGAERIKVGVMRVDATGQANAATAAGLPSIIITQLKQSPHLLVLDKRDIPTATEEQVLSASGACDQNCKIEFGKIMQSKWAVKGELNKLGSTYNLTLKVLDVETTEIVWQDEEKYTGTEDGLYDTTRTIAARLRNFLEGGETVTPTTPTETPVTPITKEKATGTLKISTTPPGATVILGAENVGRTPLTLTVPAKKHNLTLSLTGYVDISKAVTVEKDKTTEVTEEFVLQTGAISVSSTPVGASVELDGNYKGTTPLELKNVSMGTHTVKVSLDDYAEQSKAVEVKYKDVSQVTFNLSGLPGKLAVTSTPQNASVSVDGKDAGKTPLYGVSVQPGTHTVKVSLSGYKTQTQEFEISPNQEKPFSFTLEAGKSVGDWVLVYSQDFSSDPNLVTGFSEGKYSNSDVNYFYWNSKDGTLEINQPWSCIDKTVHYAYIEIPEISVAFRLEFDILVKDQVYNNDNGIRLSPIKDIQNLISCQLHYCGCKWNHSHASVAYGYADGGKCFGGSVIFGEGDSIGVDPGCSHTAKDPVYNAADGQWRHLILTYDPQSNILSVDAKYKNSDKVIWQNNKSLGGKKLREPLRYMYWSRLDVCGSGCPDTSNISKSTIDNIEIYTK